MNRSETKRAYKNQRGRYPLRHFVMLYTTFLQSDVHRVLSDEAFRLLMMLLAQKRKDEDTDVRLTWEQIQEQTGWNERKIERAGDELVALGLVERLMRVAPRDPQVWRLKTDTRDSDRFDEMLRNGKIEPPRNGKK